MKKVVLIGNPVNHSLSPLLHKKWISDFGINASYEARLTEAGDIPGLISDVREGRLWALNATLPFKAAVFQAAEAASPVAAKLGVANTLYIRSGKLFTDNTDPEGFMANLKYQAPGWRPGGTALVLGAGAAASAVLYALILEGQTRIAVCGRELAKVKDMANRFPEADITLIPWEKKEAGPADISLLVNATPLGLPGFKPLEFDFSSLSSGALVYDLVYGREPTGFLQMARASSLKTINGLGMLVFQAIPAFESWFGRRPLFDENLLAFLREEI